MLKIVVFNPNSIGKSFQTKALKQKGVLKFMSEKRIDSYLCILLVVWIWAVLWILYLGNGTGLTLSLLGLNEVTLTVPKTMQGHSRHSMVVMAFSSMCSVL